MSFVDHLYETRSQLELAKMLVQVAKENAALRDKVDALEHELFWTKVAEKKGKRMFAEKLAADAAVIDLKPEPCPHCGVAMRGDSDFMDHPKNDCLLSEWEFSQIDLVKWNRRHVSIVKPLVPADACKMCNGAGVVSNINAAWECYGCLTRNAQEGGK